MIQEIILLSWKKGYRMKKVQTSGIKFLIVFAMLIGFTHNLSAGSCSTKLFSVTIDSKLTILPTRVD